MSGPTNEFSDLDRTVLGPDGTAYRIVVQVGYGTSGWAMLWGKGKQTRDPIVTVFAKGHQVHQEPAADRKDAVRIISGLEEQIRTGTI